MEKKPENFSAGLLSIRLQLDTLLEGTGGGAAGELLDGLAGLSKTERNLLLSAFNRTVRRMANGEIRPDPESDQSAKWFEEELYSSIAREMAEAAGKEGVREFLVLDGGKSRRNLSKPPIRLKEARKKSQSERESLRDYQGATRIACDTADTIRRCQKPALAAHKIPVTCE